MPVIAVCQLWSWPRRSHRSTVPWACVFTGPGKTREGRWAQAGKTGKRWGWPSAAWIWLLSKEKAWRKRTGWRILNQISRSPTTCSHARYCHRHLQQYSCCTDNPTPSSERETMCVWNPSEFAGCHSRNHCSSSLKQSLANLVLLLWNHFQHPDGATHQHAATPQDKRCHKQHRWLFNKHLLTFNSPNSTNS